MGLGTAEMHVIRSFRRLITCKIDFKKLKINKLTNQQ
jgi:hypothetical protein